MHGLSRRHDGSLITDEFIYIGKQSDHWSLAHRRSLRFVHTSHWRSEEEDVPVLRCLDLSSRWWTRLFSKLTIACWHVARQDVLSAVKPSKSASLMPTVFRLALSASLYRLRCPPRERTFSLLQLAVKMSRVGGGGLSAWRDQSIEAAKSACLYTGDVTSLQDFGVGILSCHLMWAIWRRHLIMELIEFSNMPAVERSGLASEQ